MKLNSTIPAANAVGTIDLTLHVEFGPGNKINEDANIFKSKVTNCTAKQVIATYGAAMATVIEKIDLDDIGRAAIAAEIASDLVKFAEEILLKAKQSTNG